MKILFDTNIILDVLLLRKPFVKDALALLAFVEKGLLKGFISSTAVTTIYYLARKKYSAAKVRNLLQDLFLLFDVVESSKDDFQQAFDWGFKDFEDAVVYQNARRADCQGIVMRNLKDFSAAKLPVYSPEHLVKKLYLTYQKED
ncbi:MAG: PIN domain-containing protein [Deltaproteobacteria bacterium]|nr:PIN domain-containing protein [Deltaproteobacteria bacterium]